MRKSIQVMSVLSGLVLAGCASQPQDIQAQYVSPIGYQHLNCNQLSLEANRLNSRVSNLTGPLKEKADLDNAQMAVGMLVLWPALLFLDGDGADAQDYARLKGEVDAVEQSYIQRNCALAAIPSNSETTPVTEPVTTTTTTTVTEPVTTMVTEPVTTMVTEPVTTTMVTEPITTTGTEAIKAN